MTAHPPGMSNANAAHGAQPRVQRGVPSGGQFASAVSHASDAKLSPGPTSPEATERALPQLSGPAAPPRAPSCSSPRSRDLALILARELDDAFGVEIDLPSGSTAVLQDTDDRRYPAGAGTYSAVRSAGDPFVGVFVGVFSTELPVVALAANAESDLELLVRREPSGHRHYAIGYGCDLVTADAWRPATLPAVAQALIGLDEDQRLRTSAAHVAAGVLGLLDTVWEEHTGRSVR